MGKLDIRVMPRAKRDEIGGTRDGRLLVRVTAPPVDGKANSAVCKLIAKAASVPKGRVSIARGETGRDKVVEVEGIAPAELRERLGI